MDSVSLTCLGDDVVNRILHYVPSFGLLVEFELTSWRFNDMVKSHMKTLATVDFRDSKYCPRTQLFSFIRKRFSHKLRAVKVYNTQEVSYRCLAKSHPQLFPENMLLLHRAIHDKKYRNRFRFVDDIYMQLYSKRTVVDNLIGRHDEIKCNANDLEVWHDFVMQHKHRERFMEDFASVKSVTYSRDRQLSTITERLPLLVKLFSGLRQLILKVDTEFSLHEATNLKRFVADTTVQVRLHVEPLGHLTDDCRALVDSYVREYQFCFQTQETRSLTSLVNLEVLTIDFSQAPLILADPPDIPSSVRCLNVNWVRCRHLDVISDIIRTNGRQLDRFCLRSYRFSEDKHRRLTDDSVRRLLEALVVNCPNLKLLHIALSRLSSHLWRVFDPSHRSHWKYFDRSHSVLFFSE
ncbi:hypothetical protein HDE_10871 [Halotydeus destructor]|nr:hypothetical protein HDE_10871 [Halotydeus destructor]